MAEKTKPRGSGADWRICTAATPLRKRFSTSSAAIAENGTNKQFRGNHGGNGNGASDVQSVGQEPAPGSRGSPESLPEMDRGGTKPRGRRGVPPVSGGARPRHRVSGLAGFARPYRRLLHRRLQDPRPSRAAPNGRSLSSHYLARRTGRSQHPAAVVAGGTHSSRPTP